MVNELVPIAGKKEISREKKRGRERIKQRKGKKALIQCSFTHALHSKMYTSKSMTDYTSVFTSIQPISYI